MFMDYIHGTCAGELFDMKKCTAPFFGTPEQDRAFRKHLAEIHVSLTAHQFDKIGGLHEKEGEVVVGPDLVSGKGPWNRTNDFWKDIVQFAMKAYGQMEHDFQDMPYLHRIPELMQVYGWNEKKCSLANLDFGAHNLLVNENFEIVGLIGLTDVVAAPLEIAAQLPHDTFLERPVPGEDKLDEADAENLLARWGMINEYILMIDEAAKKYPGIENVQLLGPAMASESARIVQSALQWGVLEGESEMAPLWYRYLHGLR
jgi:hypothetical protein